mgnify:CR=1 FL=1
MEKFKVIIVEDVKLELKGTEEIFRHEIPNAEVIGTAMTEAEFWELLQQQTPDLVLLDLGLGGSTTIGVDICARLHRERPELKVLIFTGEVLNEKVVGRCTGGRSRRYHPEDRGIADRYGCTGGDGRQEACLQLSDSGEDCGTFQTKCAGRSAQTGDNHQL